MSSDLAEQVRGIMHGYGDAPTPDEESVQLVEKLVTLYVQALTEEAMRLEQARIEGGESGDGEGGSLKLDPDIFVHLCRKDHRKFMRVKELLAANVQIRSTTKLHFDEDTEAVFMGGLGLAEAGGQGGR